MKTSLPNNYKDNHITHISYISTSSSKPKQSVYPSHNFLQKPFLPQKTSPNLSKRTLVLDLDETLVHSVFKPHPNKPPNITLPITVDGKNKNIYVYTRPYVEEFLKEVSNHFEIVIFTASMRKYAAPLLNELDRGNYCTHKLYREHCSMFNGTICKDMTRLGRDLKDVIIVDNNPRCYALHMSNGINIKSWVNDFEDRELERILPILKFIIKQHNDVRDGIKLMKDEQGYFSYEKAEKLMKDNYNESKHTITNTSSFNSIHKKGQHLRIATAPLNDRKANQFQNTFLQIPYTFKTEVNTPKKLKFEIPGMNSVLSRSVRNNNHNRINHFHTACKTIDYSLDKENISKLALSNNEINSFRHSSKKSGNFQKPKWIYETKNNLIGEYYMNSTLPNTFRNKTNNPLRLLYQNNRDNKSIAITKNVLIPDSGSFNNKHEQRESKSASKKDNYKSSNTFQHLLNSNNNNSNKGNLNKCAVNNKVKLNLKLQ